MIRQETATRLPWWVLIVSVVAGLVLMTAVILILHKVYYTSFLSRTPAFHDVIAISLSLYANLSKHIAPRVASAVEAHSDREEKKKEQV